MQKSFAVNRLALVVLILIALSIGVFFLLKQFPTSIKFQNTNFSDPDTNIYFAEDQTLFSINLNREFAKKLHTFEGKITTVKLFPNTNELYIETELEKEEKRTTDGWSIKVNGQELTKLFSNVFDIQQNKKWLKYSTSEDIEARLNAYTTYERIYSGTSKNGFIDILSDKLDGKPAIEIGTLNLADAERLLKNRFSHKRLFFPSFDGSYLFETGPSGGGLGHPLLVLSRDGKYIYHIKHNIFGSSYVWLDNNKLFAQAQIGITIFTLYPGGKFDEEILNDDLQGFSGQGDLSPDRKYLAYSVGDLLIYIIDPKRRPTEQKKFILVEKYMDHAALRNEFNLESKFSLTHNLIPLGWNKKSNKLLYASSKKIWGMVRKDDKGGNFVDYSAARNLKLELKIADVLENKTYTIAILDPADKNAFSKIVIY